MKIENLKFSYETQAADNIVLDIERLNITAGGCYALLGPNGCGKTTLLKIIAKLLKPSSGTVSGNGGAVLVHQHPYLLSGSVFSNVAYGLKIRKIPHDEIKKRVEEELECWGLSGLKDRPSSSLSGGESQRTAIARAMVLKPEILLLDEPTASVDPKNIIHMEKLIEDILKTGTTVIFSTHHMDFAYRNADEIYKMDNGRFIETNENIINGHISSRDESFNVFETAGTCLFCPGRDGDFRRVVFSSDDVILSRERVNASTRNILNASVIDVEADLNEATVFLNAGFDFKARVSMASIKELEIKAGEPVYALLKSSAIRQY